MRPGENGGVVLERDEDFVLTMGALASAVTELDPDTTTPAARHTYDALARRITSHVSANGFAELSFVERDHYHLKSVAKVALSNYYFARGVMTCLLEGTGLSPREVKSMAESSPPPHSLLYKADVAMRFGVNALRYSAMLDFSAAGNSPHSS